MRNIFLSRPNWINKQYEKGLDGFVYILRAHDLEPRTIGKTDFPNQSPMDEVINLMQECVGTIVLGYPQIIMQSGQIKEEQISNSISLATEWNHIEAALSYSLHMPLLVIHDTTVSRGIFDRGTLNSFIYSLDMSDPAWPTDPTIAGALSSWVKRLQGKPIKGSRKTPVEVPTLKWGCYQFEGLKGLYCPVCYEEDALKIPASRLPGGRYKCPRCKAELS